MMCLVWFRVTSKRSSSRTRTVWHPTTMRSELPDTVTALAIDRGWMPLPVDRGTARTDAGRDRVPLAIGPRASLLGTPTLIGPYPCDRFEPAKVKETIAEVFKQKFSEGFEYNADDAAEMGTEVCTEIQARIKGAFRSGVGGPLRRFLGHLLYIWCVLPEPLCCCHHRAGVQEVQTDHAGDNRGDEGPDDANWLSVFVGRTE